MDPAASKWELLSTKVEVRLRKAAPVAWGGLEAGASSAAAPAIANDAVTPASHPPAYPSSFNRFQSCVMGCLSNLNLWAGMLAAFKL